MAPICADPRQIVISFEPDDRQALLKLVDEITQYMIFQLENPSSDLGPVALEEASSPAEEDGSDSPKGDTQGPDKTNEAQRQPSSPAARAAEPPKRPAEPSKEAARIQEAARDHMYEWKDEFVLKLAEIVCVLDDDKIVEERKRRQKALNKAQSEGTTDLIDLGGSDDKTASQDLESLQLLYKPIPTGLTSAALQDRKEALSCVLLLLLSTGKYSAHSRALTLYLASALELPQSFVDHEEQEIAKTLLESSTADQSQKDAMSAEAETAKRQQENKFSRYWKVGLASVAGAAIVGITGGLAAPLVAGAMGGILGGVGLGGVASFLGVFWMNGALVGALFGAYGAKMTGSLMDSYAKEIEDFKFIPLQEERKKFLPKRKSKEQEERRLRLSIGVNGWLNEESDIVKPWKVLGSETEVFALRYEKETLLALGTALTDLVSSLSWNVFKSEIIKRTVLATLWAALWPIQVLKMASNVDNPFSRASDRSTKAGRILADALINRVQGERPVTLIGYSLGATAIHSCLQSLAERRAFGLIDSVVIIGTPAPGSPAHWRTLRTVVSGKIFNVYSENDMILGFVYRMHSLSLGVAGLQAIEGVQGVENVNLSDSVSGHLRYPELIGEILNRCGFVGVQGGVKIEKDDVIKMKDDYKEGKLTDVDQAVRNSGTDVPDPATKGATDGLRDLELSPESSKPGETDEKNPPLPRRPTAPSVQKNQSAPVEPDRRLSRDSKYSDDGSFVGIEMTDKDSA